MTYIKLSANVCTGEWKKSAVPLKYTCCQCGNLLRNSPRRLACGHFQCGYCNDKDAVYKHCNIDNRRKEIRVDWILKHTLMKELKFECDDCGSRDSILSLKNHRYTCSGNLSYISAEGQVDESRDDRSGNHGALTSFEDTIPVTIPIPPSKQHLRMPTLSQAPSVIPSVAPRTVTSVGCKTKVCTINEILPCIFLLIYIVSIS